MSALARWAAQLTDTILAATRTEVAAVRDQLTVGTVVAVTPGAGTGNTDLVTVDWRGTHCQVAHCATYPPAVGDQVLMARPGPQLVILDKIIGGPRA